MSKKVELIHAEVIPQYGKDEVLREFTTEKGATIFSWSVKTKVNDKAEKSPVVFDTCSCFADNEERKEFIRSTVKEGEILDISSRRLSLLFVSVIRNSPVDRSQIEIP